LYQFSFFSKFRRSRLVSLLRQFWWLLLGCGFLSVRQIPLVEKNQGIGSIERVPLYRLLARGAQGNVYTAIFSQDNDR
jgi:hypothetical protein